ncbi:MAG: hypothetical protein N4Q78_05940 [Lactobacillus iners]|nr:hypothetical protein [Lactobacillus iners]
MSATQSSAPDISLIRTKDLNLNTDHYAYPYFLPFTTRHLINKHNFLSITQLISLKHLEDIEKIYAAKIKSISKSEDILSSYQFRIAFYVWKYVDKENAIEYVKNLFKDDVNKLKFLCLTTYNSLTGWEFSSENCFNIVSEEEFYDSIKNFDKSRLDEFTKEEQIKLASFVLNYENNSDDFNHATEREALRLIEKWKSESNSN